MLVQILTIQLKRTMKLVYAGHAW